MSFAITHFAVGASCTLLALAALVRAEPDAPGPRLSVVVAGGLWAMVPDAHHLHRPLRDVTKPVLHDSLLANAFWFHGLLDTVDSPHSYRLAALALAALLAVSLAVERP